MIAIWGVATSPAPSGPAGSAAGVASENQSPTPAATAATRQTRDLARIERKEVIPREIRRSTGVAFELAERGARSQTQFSAHRSLHERADLFLFGGGQLLQREVGRPHVAFVEVRLVAEAQRRIPRL